MTQYLLSIYPIEGAEPPTAEAMEEELRAVDAFDQKLHEQGAWAFAGGLHPAATATVVRMRDGDMLITDGPFAEAKEQLGGFWIIEAPDLDAALAWAREATVACQAPVEVRPFQDVPQG
jgi:hypothetical protein